MSDKKHIEIMKNKEDYDKIIKLVFDTCEKFMLTNENTKYLTGEVQKVLDNLNPYLIEKVKTFSTPVTEYDKEVTTYYFEVNEETKKIIFDVSESLFDWVEPDLPEDLMFFRKMDDEEPWLYNIAHEEYCFFETNEEDLKLINQSGICVQEVQ